MVELVGYDLYRTENLVINEIPYTVRFSASKDRSDFAMFVSNEANRKQKKYHFSEETAEDFQTQTGESLHSKVFEIIENDIAEGRI